LAQFFVKIGGIFSKKMEELFGATGRKPGLTWQQ
jgi:hypothetical protein